MSQVLYNHEVFIPDLINDLRGHKGFRRVSETKNSKVNVLSLPETLVRQPKLDPSIVDGRRDVYEVPDNKHPRHLPTKYLDTLKFTLLSPFRDSHHGPRIFTSLL